MPESKSPAVRIEPTIITDEQYGDVRISLIDERARLSLRLSEGDAAQVSILTELQLDIPIGSYSEFLGASSARIGPNEWFITAPQADAVRLNNEIEVGLTSKFFSLVDVGHRSTTFVISGSSASEIINSGCPLDLREPVFPVLSSTRTVLGKAEIILTRRNGIAGYEVECWRSFSDYIYDFLRNGAREYR
jgi:sarcosine oxidase, subunit gamma